MTVSKKVFSVGRWLKYYKLTSFSEYYHFVIGGRGTVEMQTMVGLLTTNEPDIFRERAHFEYLARDGLTRQPARTPFNV